MTCPCGSGLPTRTTAGGAPFCLSCNRAKRGTTRGQLADLPASRAFVTRQAVARRKLEERNDGKAEA
jgi:hypothetical protein